MSKPPDHILPEDVLIALDNVGVRYRVSQDRVNSFKEYLIRAAKRQMKYHEFWALQNVSIQVRKGEVFGIIGPNGAGKSTLLKVVARVIHPTTGRVRVRGRIAPLLELGAGFDDELTGRENVFLNGTILGYSEADIRKRFDRIVDFAGLWDFIDAPLRTYSTGMVARLGFSIATDVRPEILIVDEILGVGDADFQTRSYERIQQFKGEGTTILLVTHSLAKIEELCSSAIWLDHGLLQAAGSGRYVVSKYLEKTQDQEAVRLKDVAEEQETRNWGTGRVRITRVKICDENGVPQTIFKPGQLLRLEVEYQANELIPTPVFGLAIFRQDGLHITGPNTSVTNCNLPPLQGSGKVVYEIPSLPLLEGLYDFTLAFHNEEDTEFYDVIERSYPFRVVFPAGYKGETHGLVTLNGRFYHQSA